VRIAPRDRAGGCGGDVDRPNLIPLECRMSYVVLGGGYDGGLEASS
jgi:hypothetical protein